MQNTIHAPSACTVPATLTLATSPSPAQLSRNCGMSHEPQSFVTHDSVTCHTQCDTLHPSGNEGWSDLDWMMQRKNLHIQTIKRFMTLNVILKL